MSPEPAGISFADRRLVAAYEEIRSQAVQGWQRGPGLALMMARGFRCWMEACSQLFANEGSCPEFFVEGFQIREGKKYIGLDFGNSNSYLVQFASFSKEIRASQYPEFILSDRVKEELRGLEIRILLALVFVTVTWAQSSKPQPKHQVSKSNPAKKQVSLEEQLWCPVLISALSGAASAEPAMRSYLLDAVAGGLGKCAPQKVRRALIDSFIATLAIPETQEDVDQRISAFVSAHAKLDESTRESLFNLQTKQGLQESALRHLLTVDEAKVDSLLSRAEPDVRATLFPAILSSAISAKKFDRALGLLRGISSEDGFPYSEATQLMLELPPERERQAGDFPTCHGR